MTGPDSVYDTLFDRLPIGLFRISAAGEIKRANNAMARVLSYPSKEMLIGKTFTDFFHDQNDFKIMRNDLARTGEIVDLEILIRNRNRELIWVRINGRAIGSETEKDFEGALEDISDDKRARIALKESGHFAKSIIDSVAEGVVVFDQRLRISVWNAFMEELSGHPSETVLGSTAAVLYPLFEPQINTEQLRMAFGGQSFQLDELELQDRQSPQKSWYTVYFNPHFSIDGEIIGVVTTFHEVTSRKQADEKKEQVLLLEREQRVQAEALGRVSHALNAVLELSTLLELICKESSDLFHVDAALVWLVDRKRKDGHVLKNIAGAGGDHERFTGMQINLDNMNNLATRVIREREAICLNDVSETTRTGLSGIFKVRSIMAVPLFLGVDVIGVLQIIDNHKVNRFEDRDIGIAMQFGRHAANAVHNAQLYDQLQEAHSELEAAYVSTLEGWARALELRDANTEGHSTRVTEMTLRLAKVIGVSESELEHIRRGSLLHDIGKMGVPDSILSKPGPLTEKEWNVMRKHPAYAFTMLSPIDHLRPAIEIPFFHHERWDGSGYPKGLSGKDIPLYARIFAVVDVYDALTSDRPYRPAWTHEETIKYLKDESGRLFDPEMVNALLSLLVEH